MNVAWILLSSLPSVNAVTVAAPVFQSSHLERVGAQKSDFDQRAWESKLAARDLDERERAYAALVDLAVQDDAAREAVRAWSTDSARPDLAWTARLALREVERRPGTHLRALKNFGGGAMDDLRGRFDELEKRFGGLDSMFGDLQRDLDRMFPGQGPQGGAPAPGVSPHGTSRSESQSFRMQVGPDGVKIDVDEDVNGEKSTRTYTGKSLEDILEANPELKDKVGAVDGHQFLFGGQGGARGFGFRSPFGTGPDPKNLFDQDEDDRWSGPAKPLLSPSTPGKTRTDILGVLYTKPAAEVRERRKLEDGVGLEVERTEPGTIAAALGVEAGDVLVALNGRALKDREDVVGALRDRKSGEPVKLEVVDAKGRRHTLTWNES
ncbi:MAG: PDZ domain-containing protein [Planctomycetota bacterium]|nr:PDZ domain-containing protein [Planctomycetota bacterium]